MIIEELFAVIAPPSPDELLCNVVHWDDVEENLGVLLPEDYKQLVLHYGVGCVGNFLWILNPVTTNKYLNLLAYAEAKAKGMQHVAKMFQVELPYPSFPADNSLLPWAITDNGDTLFWQITSKEAKGPIVVCDIGDEGWQEFHESTISFLAKLVRKEITVEVFPDDFPDDVVTFVPQQ